MGIRQKLLQLPNWEIGNHGMCKQTSQVALRPGLKMGLLTFRVKQINLQILECHEVFKTRWPHFKENNCKVNAKLKKQVRLQQ